MFDGLFDSSLPLTPHGFCLTWQPGLIWLHAGSDAVIGLAYYSIPLALLLLWRRRPDIEFGWLLSLFATFILACGTTHFMAILTLWVPAYTAEGLVKLATAIISVATAIVLWPLVPRLAALPSPRALRTLNERLSASLASQVQSTLRLRESEEAVRLANAALEARVEERTAALSDANARLQEIVADRDRAVASLGQAKHALEGAVVQARQALAQRDVLLREVYHRVKNNLQMIDGMLFIEAHRLTDPEARTAIGKLHDRIYALALVHQQLMQSDDLETFDLAPFLTELTQSLTAGAEASDLRVEVRAMPLFVGLDTAIPLGLMVTELVTNAVRQAVKGGGGKLVVDLTSVSDGAYALAVDENLLAEALVGGGSGPSGETSRSVRGLAAQLDAELVQPTPQRTEVHFHPTGGRG